jgi:hypothetical protein
MALFKSRRERQIERTIQVQKTLGMFTGQIKKLRKQEDGYIQTARDARRAGAPQQEGLAKRALRATLAQRRRLEQELLTLKILSQIKEQTEAHAQFAKSLVAVSRTIADLFRSTDLASVEKQLDKAATQAGSMSERIDLFLSSASGVIFGEPTEAGEEVTDEEIDALIEEEAVDAEQAADDEIDQRLNEIRAELGEKS